MKIHTKQDNINLNIAWPEPTQPLIEFSQNAANFVYKNSQKNDPTSNSLLKSHLPKWLACNKRKAHTREESDLTVTQLFLFDSYNLKEQKLRKLRKCMLKDSTDSITIEDDSYLPTNVKRNQKLFKRWTIQENARYRIFLEAHKALFSSEYSRRVGKAFKYLSQFVKTKSQNQCKSHHQKMMKKNNNSIDEVILSLDFTIQSENTKQTTSKESNFSHKS